MRSVVLLGLALWSTNPFATMVAQQNRADDTKPKQSGSAGGALMPGDAIRLSGTREAELPGDYLVDEAGTVVLPLLGSRSISGVRAADLKRQLAADYRQQLRNQDVQIALLRRVRVIGAVKNPGIYHVDPTMSVADAIALAGGATQEGKPREVQVLRAGKVIRSGSDADALVVGEINSGDEITVPERSWLSRNGRYVIGGLITAVAIVAASAISN